MINCCGYLKLIVTKMTFNTHSFSFRLLSSAARALALPIYGKIMTRKLASFIRFLVLFYVLPNFPFTTSDRRLLLIIFTSCLTSCHLRLQEITRYQEIV